MFNKAVVNDTTLFISNLANNISSSTISEYIWNSTGLEVESIEVLLKGMPGRFDNVLTDARLGERLLEAFLKHTMFVIVSVSGVADFKEVGEPIFTGGFKTTCGLAIVKMKTASDAALVSRTLDGHSLMGR
jgi:hypothetical protein